MEIVIYDDGEKRKDIPKYTVFIIDGLVKEAYSLSSDGSFCYRTSLFKERTLGKITNFSQLSYDAKMKIIDFIMEL